MTSPRALDFSTSTLLLVHWKRLQSGRNLWQSANEIQVVENPSVHLLSPSPSLVSVSIDIHIRSSITVGERARARARASDALFSQLT